VLIKIQLDATVCRYLFTAKSDFAVNKYLHTVASSWIFINIYTRPVDTCACTHPHTFVHTQTCLHMRAHTHTHTHTHMCVCTLFPLVCSKVRRDNLISCFLSVCSLKVWLWLLARLIQSSCELKGCLP